MEKVQLEGDNDSIDENENMDETPISANMRNTLKILELSGIKNSFLTNGRMGGMQVMNSNEYSVFKFDDSPILEKSNGSPQKSNEPKMKSTEIYVKNEENTNELAASHAPSKFSKEHAPKKQAVFQIAYDELKRKIFSEQNRELALLLSPKDLKMVKNYRSPKEIEKELDTRLAVYRIQYERRKEAVEKHKILHDLKDCTFAPKIENSSKPRKLEDFYNDQMKYVEQRDQKIVIMRALEGRVREIEEKDFYKPEICDRSKLLAKKKRSNSADGPKTNQMDGESPDGEKQTDDNKKDSKNATGTQRKVSDSLLNHLSFIPSINQASKEIARDEKIDDILYFDALRRQGKNLAREIEYSNKNSSPLKYSSENSNKILFQKFVSDFDDCFKSIDTDNVQSLDFLQICCLLEFMGYLTMPDAFKPDENLHKKEGLMIKDIWHMLHSKDTERVAYRNLKLFLLAVMGFYFPWMSKAPVKEEGDNKLEQNANDEGKTARTNVATPNENGSAGHDEVLTTEMKQSSGSVCSHLDKLEEESESIKESKQSSLLTFIDGQIVITDQQMEDIHRIFQSFFQNRMNHAIKSNREKRAHVLEAEAHIREEKKSTFQPKLCDKSRKLAEKRVEKLANAYSKSIDLLSFPEISKLMSTEQLKPHEMLILQGKLKEFEIEKEKYDLRQKEREACTFQPKTNDFKSHSNIKRVELDKKAWDRLYAKRQKEKKPDADPLEIEYEKSKKECTFAPKINPKLPTSNRIISKSPDVNFHSKKEVPSPSKGFVFTKESYKKPPISARKMASVPEKPTKPRLNATSKAKNINVKEVSKKKEAPVLPSPKNNSFVSSVEVKSEKPETSSQETRKKLEEMLQRAKRGRDAKQGGSETRQPIPQPEKKRTPLLLIEVNIGANSQSRIVIYEGDTAESVSRDFSKKHQLDAKTEEKLKGIVETQMKNLIPSMKEETAA